MVEIACVGVAHSVVPLGLSSYSEAYNPGLRPGLPSSCASGAAALNGNSPRGRYLGFDWRPFIPLRISSSFARPAERVIPRY